VAPGYTRTDRVVELAEAAASREGTTPEVVQRRTEEKIPLKRLGTPAELGDVVAFLASERASYITGTTIQVDGGFVRSLL
jgi:3-oxoacyl-[acyl-carrier protein] reductase